MFDPADDATCNATGHDAPLAPQWFAGLGRDGGFAADPRFLNGPEASPPLAHNPQSAIDVQLAAAFEEGRLRGRSEAERDAAHEQTERRKLGSALRRMDEDMVTRLGEQLSATVAALCEATLQPLTLDTELLARRCSRAAAMIDDSHSACVLHLHPDDIARLDDEFLSNWRIEPDPALAQGALRLEGGEGGIADGPEEWQRALAEALAAC